MKKGITLIELMVVVIVLGILALIALPNVKNVKHNAQISAALENRTNTQKAVDRYVLDNQTLPVTTEPSIGNPSQIEWTKIVPKYLRTNPQDTDKMHYWIDYNGTVWSSDVEAPTGVTVAADNKSITWDAIDGAESYNVGYVKQVASKNDEKISAGYQYKLLGTSKSTAYTSNIDLSGSTVVVSAESKNSLETAPVGPGYVADTTETNPTGVKQIATGVDHTLFLLNDGTVWACGDNGAGQLGSGTATDSNKPVKAIDLSNVVQIAAGNDFSLALLNDGTVKTWGWGSYNGLGEYYSKTAPTTIPGLSNVKQISVCDRHAVILLNDGTIKVWGFNAYGSLGTGDTNDVSIPTTIEGINNVKQVIATDSCTILLFNDGSVKGAGYNYYGELATHDMIQHNTYTSAIGSTDIKELSNGLMNVFALLNDGNYLAWGSNTYGQLGDGIGTGDRSSMVAVKEFTNIKQITGGNFHTVVLSNDGTIETKGRNGNGQLGNGTTTDCLTAVKLSGLNNVKEVAAQNSGTFFILNDGTVKACGCNNCGQLGIGTTSTNVTAPTTVELTN